MAVPTCDLTDFSNYRNGFPHDFFTWLRANDPVYWHEPTEHTPGGEGFWVVTRHADVSGAYRDPVTYSSETGGNRKFGGTHIADSKLIRKSFNMMDGRRHRRIRIAVNQAFKPVVLKGLEPQLRACTRGLLDAVQDKGECDFAIEIAEQLPRQAVCMIIGVPPERRREMWDLVDAGIEFRKRGPDQTTADDAETSMQLVTFFLEHIAEKRARPGDDGLSLIMQTVQEREDPPSLTDHELVHFLVVLTAVGADTTRMALAGGLHELIHRPDQLAILRDHPEVIGRTGADEIARWTSSTVHKRRTATRDVELRGKKIRAGDKVTLWETSANRDEEVFDKPFDFDVRRHPNPHVAFGAGVHRCLGAPLAKMEIQVMFEELVPRWDEIELAGETVWFANSRLAGPMHMPVRFRARALA